MLSSSLDTLLKVSKTTSTQKLFAYDCVTLYVGYLDSMNVCFGVLLIPCYNDDNYDGTNCTISYRN